MGSDRGFVFLHPAMWSFFVHPTLYSHAPYRSAKSKMQVQGSALSEIERWELCFRSVATFWWSSQHLSHQQPSPSSSRIVFRIFFLGLWFFCFSMVLCRTRPDLSKVLEGMVERRDSPDGETWLLLLNAVDSAGALDKAVELLERSRAEGHGPEVRKRSSVHVVVFDAGTFLFCIWLHRCPLSTRHAQWR